MSLIPFILDLADELHEFNRCLAAGGMDVDDFGFGIYPHELQQQPQQQQHHLLQSQSPQQSRRPRAVSQLYWLPTISKGRHHPYYRSKTCCNKSAPSHLVTDSEKESPTANLATAASAGLAGSGDKEGNSSNAAGKSAYSVVNKNGFQVSMNVKQFAPNELTVKTIDNCIVVEGQHEDKEDGHGVISRHFIRKYMLPKGYDPNEVLSTLSSDGILTVKAPPPTTKTDEPMERIVDIQQTGPAHLSVKDSNKEQQKTTVTATAAAATAAATAANATAVPQQQQQQQQQSQPQPQPQKELQKQSQSQSQQQPELQKLHERNGNVNPNEICTEQETEPAEPTASSSSNTSTSISFNSNTNTNSNTNINSSTNSISISNSTEQPGAMLLTSKAAAPATAIDAIMAAATTTAAAANDEDNKDANMDVDVNVHVGTSASASAITGSNSHTDNNDAATIVEITSCNSNNNSNSNANDNGLAETPTAAVVVPVVAMPADVTVVGIETIPVTVIGGAVAVAEDDVEGMDGVVVGVGVSGGVAAIGGGDEDGETAGVDTLMVAAQPPTAADLVAAADAAILLAKTQCENGNGQKAVVTEEITN